MEEFSAESPTVHSSPRSGTFVKSPNVPSSNCDNTRSKAASKLESSIELIVKSASVVSKFSMFIICSW